MKYLKMLIICLLIAFQAHSQTISKKEQPVKVVINAQGDTLLQMHLSDAKIILKDILEKEITDSLLTAYIEKDRLNSSIIQLQLSEIKLLQERSTNQETLNKNLNLIIKNKDDEIVIYSDIIKKQKKEIRNQKIQKFLAFSAAFVLTITIIIFAVK